MILHQTVHGYRDGHRMLAASTPLTSDEQRDLDLLSDQSGILPDGVSYGHYETGYPTGRWFVFARTWIDHDAERRGTVWTHSLLAPLTEVADVADLRSLDALWRRPERPLDGRWQQPLQLALGSGEPVLATADVRDGLERWLGEARPVLWEDNESAARAVRVAWALLPPWQRARFSFCTFAIHPRHLRDELLTWQAPAPRSTTPWFRLRQQVAPKARLVGADLLTDSDAARSVWSRVRGLVGTAHGARLRVALRYLTLASRTDFAASLAELDCVEAMGLDGEAVAEAVVRRSMDRLPVNDLPAFSQWLLREPARRAPSLANEIATLQQIALERFVSDPTADLDTLVSAARRAGLSDELDTCVWRALVHLPADEIAGLPALRGRTHEVLERRSDADEAAWTLHKRGEGDAWGWIAANPRAVQWGALRGVLDDADVRRLFGDPPPFAVDSWRDVLACVALPLVVDGLPHVAADGPLREALVFRMADLGVGDAQALSLPWRDEVLWAMVDRRASALADHPASVSQLLSAPEHPGAARLATAIAGGPHRLALLRSIAPGIASSWAQRLEMDACIVAIDDAMKSDQALDKVAAWLEAISPRERWRVVDHLERPRSVKRAVQIVARHRWHSADLRRMVMGWMREPDLEVGGADWKLLLRSVVNPSDREDVAAVLLRRALNGDHTTLAALAIAALPDVHRALCRSDAGIVSTVLSFVWGKDWDRAKATVEATADAWLRQRWPPASLIEMSGDDPQLWRRLCKAVRRLDGTSRLRPLFGMVSGKMRDELYDLL